MKNRRRDFGRMTKVPALMLALASAQKEDAGYPICMCGKRDRITIAFLGESDDLELKILFRNGTLHYYNGGV